MAGFDPDAFLAAPAAPAAPAFDPEAFLKEAPKSIGRAAQDLPREQELRAQYLKDQLQSGAPGYTARLKDSATMGLMRPIGGVMRGVSGVFDPTSTFGERYRAGVGAEEDYIKEAEKNTPGALGTAVDVVGGLATGGPAGGFVSGAGKTAVKEAPTLAKIIASGAGQGAVEGAARNAESVPNALVGAGVGGTIGAATSGTVGALTNRLAGSAAKKAVSEATDRAGGSEPLKEAGGAIYKKLDDAGIHFKDTKPLLSDTAQTMADKGFNKELHKELVPALEQIGNLKGKPATWTELQNIRTQLSDAKASDDKRVRRMAGHLNNVLDDFIDTAKPTIPASKLGTVSPGDPAKARDLWRRGSQAENVEYLAEKGMTTAKDPARKLETNFGREIDRVEKPGRFNPNNPEQMKLMENIARGDPRRAALASGMNRWGNNLIGYGTAGAAGGAGLASIFGDQYGVGSGTATAPGMAAIGAGLLAKRGGSSLNKAIAGRGQERVNALIRNIATGDTKTPATANVPREALAKILAAEQLKRGASRYTSSKFDKE